MSLRQKASLVWLIIMVSFVSGAMALHAYIGEPEFSAGAMDQLIEAATAHAHALREGGDMAEAERWDRLAASAKAELAAQ
jgi:hypothetical protein